MKRPMELSLMRNHLVIVSFIQVRHGRLQRAFVAVAGSEIARSTLLPSDSHPTPSAALSRSGCFSLKRKAKKRRKKNTFDEH